MVVTRGILQGYKLLSRAVRNTAHPITMAINCSTGLFRAKDMPLLRVTKCITGLFRTKYSHDILSPPKIPQCH